MWAHTYIGAVFCNLVYVHRGVSIIQYTRAFCMWALCNYILSLSSLLLLLSLHLPLHTFFFLIFIYFPFPLGFLHPLGCELCLGTGAEGIHSPVYWYLLLGGAPHRRKENMRCWHIAKSLGAPPAVGDRWYVLLTAPGPGECPLQFYQPNPPFMVTGSLCAELLHGRANY